VNFPIRVLLADDSGFMRLYVRDILQRDGTIQVVGTAGNGLEAVERTLEHRPDVVVMDMNMGQYDGCYGIEHIMKRCPTPIVIDYVNKPAQNNTKVKEVEIELFEKILAASSANLAAARNAAGAKVNAAAHTFSALNYDVVVIGSSTGGPGALETLIKRLPSNMAVPVLIAQHMPPAFVPSFAERLNELTPLQVSMARLGDVLKPGHILLAPGSRNMVVHRNAFGEVVVHFEAKTYAAYNHPSVDGLMLSVASTFGSRAIGVILTGMGKDGALGMKSIREQGGFTVAQSKETCVVYGMPKEVVNNGDAMAVVPVDEMGGFLVSCLS
jgi:two-component system, chemotaxis family, protein-glutamate methylesterase/glutaminase